ncbi:hypothetical protein HDZ31DRAFT_72678 [Schizophyllum fasciatum]
MSATFASSNSAAFGSKIHDRHFHHHVPAHFATYSAGGAYVTAGALPIERAYSIGGASDMAGAYNAASAYVAASAYDVEDVYDVDGMPPVDDLATAMSSMALGGVGHAQPTLPAHAPHTSHTPYALAHPAPSPHNHAPFSWAPRASAHVTHRRRAAKAPVVPKRASAADRRARVAVAYRTVHRRDALGNTHIEHVRLAPSPPGVGGWRRVGALRRRETFLTSEFVNEA